MPGASVSPPPTASPPISSATLSKSKPMSPSANETTSASPPAGSVLPSSPHSHMILAGLISGVSVASLFNPIDRALYLSVLYSRPFLHRDNFRKPFTGFLQVAVHRTLSGGIYFPLFDMSQPLAKGLISSWASHHPSATDAEQTALMHFICGNSAGAVSGIMLNSLTAIKYSSWDKGTGFFLTARTMYSEGGLHPFFKGINATVVRDTIFGGAFALMKFHLVKSLKPYVKEPPIPHILKQVPVSATTAAALTAAERDRLLRYNAAASTATTIKTPSTTSTITTPTASPSSPSATDDTAATSGFKMSAGTADFTAALLAGFVATTVSAPFNYIRNIKYSWVSHSHPPAGYRILLQLWKEARNSDHFAHHLQDRLKLGWGTARVAVGMAVGQYIYENSKKKLEHANFP